MSNYVNDLRKCCLELEAIPENYIGRIIITVPTDAGAADVNVSVVAYRSGITTPSQTIGQTSLPAPNSTISIDDTTDLSEYFSRYDTIVIEAFLSSGTRVNFEDAAGDLHPAVCFCIKPCVPGVTNPAILFIGEKIPLCEDVVCN